MAQKNQQIEALLELERRDMQNPGTMPDELKAKLKAYRDQGVVKPLASDTGSKSSSTEGERKANAFLIRAMGANTSYEGTGVEPRGMLSQQFKESFPNASNYLASDERQVADSAQDEFIAATLRQDSGAAIPTTEMESQRRIYFPMPGDGADVIEQKRQARVRALQGLVASAGGMVTDEQKKAIEALVSAKPPQNMAEQKKQEMLGTLVPTDVANKIEQAGLTKEQQDAYDAFNRANPHATAEQLRGFAASINMNLKNAEDIVKAREQGGGVLPGATGIVRPPDISDVRGKDDAAEGADAAIRGAADTLSLGFADEISAGAKTLFSGGTMDENLRRERAIDAYDAEYSPWLRGGGQLAGGFLLPIGAGAKTAGELAKVGGGMGAAYGIGSGEDWSGRITGGVTGGLSGAALGYGLGKVASRIGNRTPPDPNGGNTAGRNIYNAAQDLGIDVLPSDVGGAFTKRMTAGAVQTPFGAGPILARSQRTIEQAQAARNTIANEAVSPTTDYAAGRAAQRGLTGWIKKSDTRASRLYDNISIAPEAQAQTGNTINALNEITKGMESNPELSRIWTGYPRLRQTLEAITVPEVRQTSNAVGYPVMEKRVGDQWVKMTQQEIDSGRPMEGGVSWQDMKRLRSIIGEIIGSPSLGTEGNEQAAMRKLYGALSDDMRATAERSGPKALREFDRANDFYRARENRIASIIAPILGKDMDKGGQAAFNQIQNWASAKGESAKLSQMMRSLPADEADTVSATIISKLGNSGAGAQNAAGDAFSLSTFLTHWNRLDPRAKASLFRPEQRTALDKLATVAEGTKEAQRFANTSNTAGGLNANATSAGLLGAFTAAMTGHPIVALAAASPAIGQAITGRLMASPKFVNWLVRVPKGGEGLRGHIAKLGKLSSQNPVFSADIARLEQALISAANDNVPLRAAASEGQEKNSQGQ